ncbi:hypothetical protein KAR48_15220 [bacterium]|nr:hypothetical protein [bacterium]
MKRHILSFFILASGMLSAQGLFESAVTETAESESSASSVEINGFMRGVIYAGQAPISHDADLKAAYAELDLQFRARKDDWGQGFAQFRLRRGTEFGEAISEIVLREAYASLYTGPIDLRIGHQIIVWGRADGVNPTNNITPQNMLLRSPDEDDRREGNMMLRAFYNLQPLRLELIWTPIYASSMLPLGLIPLPEMVRLNDTWTPPALLEESNLAFKLHYEAASIDGSLSYFNGYVPLPGLAAEIPLDGSAITITPTPYRSQIWGADFQTTVGVLGLRGELAWKNPSEDYAILSPYPNDEFHYVLGLDRSWGDFNLILQYEGKHIPNWKQPILPAVFPLDPLGFMLVEKNRMIAGQLDKTQHGLVCRPSWTLMHETLSLEMLTLYKLTTEEWMLAPRIRYHLADALTLIAGADLYGGPDETLFGTVRDTFSAGFIALKASF